MNELKVKQQCTVSAPGLVDRIFVKDELVQPSSPYYFAIKWAGLGTDTGNAGVQANDLIDAPGAVVISVNDPGLLPGSIWIQVLPNGNYTIWEEDGK